MADDHTQAGGTPFETVLIFRVAWVFEGAVRVVEHTSVPRYCQAMKVPVADANFVELADPPLFFYLSFRQSPTSEKFRTADRTVETSF